MANSRILILAGVFGASGVLLGAFGAHALKDFLAVRQMTSTWQTAVLYQLVHSVALLAAAAIHAPEPDAARWVRRAHGCWGAGVILFSGSLYALALGAPAMLGPVTPVGGLFLVAGWICAGIAGARSRLG